MATNLWAQIERLWANLRALGVRRLSALALIGVAVFATTGLAGYYLSRPTMETLYSGLDRDDIAAIGAALREAVVPFDVNAESTVVLTPAGQAAAARMILAEKGQPFDLEATGMQARVIQHEMDHLEGVLFIDLLSPVARDRIKKRIQKHGFPKERRSRAFAL